MKTWQLIDVRELDGSIPQIDISNESKKQSFSLTGILTNLKNTKTFEQQKVRKKNHEVHHSQKTFNYTFWAILTFFMSIMHLNINTL